jgi:hypothetical protein
VLGYDLCLGIEVSYMLREERKWREPLGLREAPEPVSKAPEWLDVSRKCRGKQ